MNSIRFSVTITVSTIRAFCYKKDFKGKEKSLANISTARMLTVMCSIWRMRSLFNIPCKAKKVKFVKMTRSKKS